MAPVARPEIELVLRAARTAALDDPANAERLRALATGTLDWAEVITLAQAQGVLPLVWNTLERLAATGLPASLPPAVKAEALAHLQHNLRRSLLLTRALVEGMARLEAAGIPVLPYKGPVLAAQVYGRISHRWFGDIDILVHRRDVAAARAVLAGAGYRQVWPEGQLSAAQEQLHLATKYNYTYHLPATAVTLELHWTLTPNYLGFPADAEALWAGTGIVNLGGKALPTFSAPWQLLVLAMHGANHCWLKLSQVCDVAEMVRATPDLDWNAVEALAHTNGCVRVLHLSLALAQALLDAPLPPEVAARVAADRPATRLAAQVVERFCTRPYHWLGPFEEPRFHLRMRERWRDKARYVAAMAQPTVRDMQAVRLPAALSFLYYLIRPARLAAQYGAGLWANR